ncbi:MAG: hypothetical protein KDK97_04035 [Verrucomicrobiales bacterium]|nr:hypothetical protein [Verrucomicrobiales bacterium]MCP5557183.1 hypothetical protein [Verrucomicrobiaceae bacterium]
MPRCLHAESVRVELLPDGGMLRGGERYFIKGAGAHDPFAEVAQRGGNSIRIWSERDLPQALEAAEKLDLTVCAGIWLEPECSWFSYANPQHCKKQLERVRQVVRQYRDHASLLLWGIGNESEGDGGNDAYWQQLNRLARMVHEEDPAHPTFTAVAGLSPEKAAGLNQHTPDLDLVGINTYAALPALREHLVKVGWTRPWVVTEFGPKGFWESPQTAWKAAIEQTSTQKAATIRTNYQKTIAPAGMCVGSYLFLWGQKQEATSTWFGVFTASGESTETADVMQELWAGKVPSNQAPRLTSMKCSATALKSAQVFTAQVEANDADGDPLQFRWEIADDLRKRDQQGREKPPPLIQGLIKADGNRATIHAPAKPGAYRVFVFVSDGKGHAATANVPLQVSD